jgi:hypothetical protein
MDSSKIKAIIVVVIALFVALYLGVSAATAQTETIAWVLGILAVVICLAMGRRIWMLLPFMGALELTFRVPGQPSTMLMAQAAVVGMCALLLLMRRLPFRLRITELEILMVLVIGFVVQAYLRNPVGFSVFGTETVGGKPYIIFIITSITTFLMSGLRVEPPQLRNILSLSILGGIGNLMVGIAGLFSPFVNYYTGGIYTTDGTFRNDEIDEGAAGRIPFLSIFSRNLSLWASAFISPVAALISPLWGILCVVAVAAAAASGFRSAILGVILTFAIATFYRGGRGQVMFGLFAAAGGLALLAAVNLAFPLPPTVQRALTFLPGTWEERYKLDAKGSTDWRTEIWIEALTSNRYIRNKWLGDGLGFSRQDLEKSMAITIQSHAGTSGWDAQREAIMLSGDYHSSAVSTVRTCGYVGLAALVLVMLRVVVHAHREMKQAKGSMLYPVTLFIGIPPMVSLITFPISSSNFLQVASALFLTIGYIRMLQNNRIQPPAA